MPVKKINLPSLELLNELFTYDSETGVLTWKKEVSRKRVAGKEAGTVHGEGYRTVGIDYRRYFVHRIIWKLVTGDDPDEIDHIDGNRSNNKINNLRSVCRKENKKNVKKPSNNTSGTIGVCFDATNAKWFAYIKVNQRFINLGLFNLFEEAVTARRAAELKYNFHQNHGRD